MRFWALSIAGLLLFSLESARGATGEIIRSAPSAIGPGRTTEVAFAGDRMQGLTNSWTSFSCKSEFVKSSGKEAIFRLTVASNVPVQIGAVRLAGSNALSTLALLMVDDLPTFSKTNATKTSPQSLTSGTAIEGRVGELQSDCFSFQAKKKESFSIEILAHRIGSALDPLLRIIDAKGNELVYSLAFNEPNGDPKIRFVAPEAGSYVMELRDVSYRGGEAYFYRMRFGKFPLVTATFPPVVQRGKLPKLELTGPAIDRANASPAATSTSGEQTAVPISAQFAKVPGFGFTELLVSDLPQVMEKEPNDTPAQATPIALPVGVNGRFEKQGDRDYYVFSATKGDHISCLARTRSLGVPCDVSLQLFDSENKSAAESKNTGSDEGMLSATIEKSGQYRLLVEELTVAGRPDFVYHVSIESKPPGFSLTVGEDYAQLSSNGIVTLNVSCLRDGYNGPVTLKVHGLDNAQTGGSTIAAKKTNTVLTISLPQSAQNHASVFTLFGEGTNASAAVPASTIPALRKSFPNLLYLPEQLNGLIWIPPIQTTEAPK